MQSESATTTTLAGGYASQAATPGLERRAAGLHVKSGVHPAAAKPGGIAAPPFRPYVALGGSAGEAGCDVERSGTAAGNILFEAMAAGFSGRADPPPHPTGTCGARSPPEATPSTGVKPSDHNEGQLLRAASVAASGAAASAKLETFAAKQSANTGGKAQGAGRAGCKACRLGQPKGPLLFPPGGTTTPPFGEGGAQRGSQDEAGNAAGSGASTSNAM